MDLWSRRQVFGVLLVSVVLVESASGLSLVLQFVNESQCFEGAQQWCEERGGHLAFLTNPLVQDLLQTVLEPDQFAWIGLRRDWTTDQGWTSLTSPWAQHRTAGINYGFFWLDGYPLDFSVWAMDSLSPVLNPDLSLNQSFSSDCALVLGSSGYRWAMTSDCEQELPFICQYGSERSVWTLGQSDSISCGTNQVLVLDQLYLVENTTVADCSPASLLPQLQEQCDCSYCSLPVQTLCECSASETLPKLFYYCTTDWNLTVVGCYSGSKFFSPSSCSALYGQTLHIEVTAVLAMEVWVTVDGCDSDSTNIVLVEANHSANITVPNELLQIEGSHTITVHYRSNETQTEDTRDLQVYVWKPLVGLQVQTVDSTPSFGLLALNVTVDQGSPAQIVFYIRTSNWTHIETDFLNSNNQIYNFRFRISDVENVRIVVVNTDSNVETEEELSRQSDTTNSTQLALNSSTTLREAFTDVLLNFSVSNECPGQINSLVSNFITLIQKRELLCTNQTFNIFTNGSSSSCSINTTVPTTITAAPTTTTIPTTAQSEPLSHHIYLHQYIHLNVYISQYPHCAKPEVVTHCPNYIHHLPYHPHMRHHVHHHHHIRLQPYYLQRHLHHHLQQHLQPFLHQQLEHDLHHHLQHYVHHDLRPYLHNFTSPPVTSTHLHHPHVSYNRPPHSHHYIHHIHHNHPPPTDSTPQTGSYNGLQCFVTPPTGTMLQVFTISCTTETSSNLKYCFSAPSGKSLGCSLSFPSSLFLPQGEPQSINVMATNGQLHLTNIVTMEVTDVPSSVSLPSIQESLLSNINLLQSQNQLTAEGLGQLLTSVGQLLNSRTEPFGQKQQFREAMLDMLLDVLQRSLVSTPCPVQIQYLVSGVLALMQTQDVHTSTIMTKASELLLKLSRRLLQTLACPDFKDTVFPAAESIITAANALLGLSPEQSVSNNLMVALENAQTALLQATGVQTTPTVISQGQIAVMVHRVTPDQLQALVSVPDSFGPWFDLQTLPLELFKHEPLVDIRMMTLQHNPFSGNTVVSPAIVSLKLTTPNGFSISVKDLDPEIQIFFPNLNTTELNATILDLHNFSTIILNLPTAQSSLLIKMIPSEDPLPFKVYLGEKHPSDSTHLAMTEMPRPGNTLVERYSWFLDSEDLKGASGELFLFVRPVVGPGIKSINASLSIMPVGTRCNFWNESEQDWSTAGCRVGPLSSIAVTQCLCDHLTFFGRSFFVVPNLVDPSRSAELFGTFTENPVVVSLVIALFLAYILALIWARYKDLKDTTKVKVTALADNEPSDRYQYLVTVRTGYRRGAATSSKVTLMLMGSSGSSAPHHLSDSRKPLFERGATDMFILKTSTSLGQLQGIRLWHNNSGGHPDWFVSSVMVQDLQTMEKAEILCNSWISVNFGDDGLHQHFLVSTEEELKKFRHLFVTKFSRDFCDGHLWYSVANRPPSSTFSRVQRLSCCFSLLLCTMLTSIMFYGIPTDPSEQVMDLGHFEFTWQQFMVGVQSALIMFPINILIVSLFRYSRPRDKPCCGPQTCCGSRTCCLTEFFCGPFGISKPDQNSVNYITKKVSKVVKSLSKSPKETKPKSRSRIKAKHEKEVSSILTELEDYIFQRNVHRAQSQESGDKPYACNEDSLFSALCRLEDQLRYMEASDLERAEEHEGRDVQKTEVSCYSSLLHWVKELKDRLKETSTVHVYSLPGSVSRGRSLPHWCVYVGWFLVLGSSCVCGYFTMLYGLKFGREKSISWLVSMFVSFFQSLLVTQPLKVVGMAVFFALVMKKLKDEEMVNVYIYHDIGQKDLSLYEPPPAGDIEKMRMKRLKEKKAYALITEILVYLGFLWMLLLVAYGQRDPNTFYLNQHVLQSIRPASAKTRVQTTVHNQNPSMNLDQIFQWTKTTLLPNLYGQYRGFITDGNSKLVGVARLRQLRVIGPSCESPEVVHFPKDCNPSYSWRWEDTGSYGPKWTPQTNGTGRGPGPEPGPWTYQTQEQLRGSAVWGRNHLYRGGGYSAELGPDLHNASSTLQYLYSERWLDSMTRAVFVEFTVYNANVNLFCIATLLFETSAVGAFEFMYELRTLRLHSSTGGLYAFVMFGEILYVIFILYYMYLEFKAIRRQRWSYFRNKWNLVELSIIVLSWTGVGVFAQRTVMSQRDIAFYQDNKDKFCGFYSTAVADAVLQYVIAFVVLLATVKLWHLLRLNPNMNLISSALSRAAGDISGFILVIALMLIAFASACNTLYGWQMASYKTFSDSLITLIKLQLGIFNYEEVLDYSPVLGAFLIGSCIILMGFVILNLLISVILMAFKEEQIHHKPSDEEEIVQMMLKKVFGLFGVNYKASSAQQQEKHPPKESPQRAGGDPPPSRDQLRRRSKVLRRSVQKKV